MANWNMLDLGERAAKMPTLLEQVADDVKTRAYISRTTREEDAAQRIQSAWNTLEGVDEQPATGMGALFGQRPYSRSQFRTREEAAAYLRAQDPERFTKTTAEVGGFMANVALPRLTGITDPRERVAALTQMSTIGPPMLKALVTDISADGVITDEEMAQATGMFESFKKPDAYVNLGQQGVFNATRGEVVSGTARDATVPSAIAPYKYAADNPNDPASQQFLADREAARAAANRRNTGGGGGRQESEWEVKRRIRNDPGSYSAADQAWAAGGDDLSADEKKIALMNRIATNPNATPMERAWLEAEQGKGSEQSVRLNMMITRSLSAGNLTAAVLEDITRRPLGDQDMGLGGVNSAPGTSLLTNGRNALLQHMSSSSVRAYNTKVGGLKRELGGLISLGYVPTQAVMDAMNSVLFVEGDTQADKMRKLAIIKRDVIETIHAFNGNPALRGGQESNFRNLESRLNRAVPYDVADVDALDVLQMRNPRATMADVIRGRTRQQQQSAEASLTGPNPFAVPGSLPPARPSAPAPASGGWSIQKVE